MADDEPGTRRTPVWLVGAAAVLAVSAVIAALVIFSSGSGTTTETEPAAPVAAREASLVLGPPDARHQVVVWEDFGCPTCRDFDVASRDFLDIEAGLGDVRVEYHPLSTTGSDWSRRALRAWLAVLASGTPKQARDFHDRLMDLQPTGSEPGPEDADLADAAARLGVDRQVVAAALEGPPAGSDDAVATAGAAAARAGVSEVPTVMLDGEPLRASSGTSLADALQARITEE